MENIIRRRRLSLLFYVCGFLMVPSVLAWIVNVELAIRVAAPEWRPAEILMPALFQRLAVLGADLSTISTLVPVLLLLFPMVMARKVLAFGDDADVRLRRLVYDPYPPHFAFFLVMLGLAGTLYGLLIGLDVSGVGELGKGIPSPETIQKTLDQLLGGTATALLSSLLGLAGAFLAARPLTWIFHRAAQMPSIDEPASLSETLGHLIGDLQSLGVASREFSDGLRQTDLKEIPATLHAIRDELTSLREAMTSAMTEGHALQSRQLELQREGQRAGEERARQAAADMAALKAGLTTMSEALGRLENEVGQGRSRLADMAALLEDHRTRSDRHGQTADDQRIRMIEVLQAGQRERETDRKALRNAFSRFIESGESSGTAPGQAGTSSKPANPEP